MAAKISAALLTLVVLAGLACAQADKPVDTVVNMPLDDLVRQAEQDARQIKIDLAGLTTVNGRNPYSLWSRGPESGSDFFPIAVWLQSPSKAAAYKQAGVNVYVGLYQGPTAEQIAELKKAGMKVICGMNNWAKQNMDEETIIGWMHGDEPDNAQRIDGYWGGDKNKIRKQWPHFSQAEVEKMSGYGPSISPSVIIEDYHKLMDIDPTRPILLNLGQSVAYTDWGGRGPRSRHQEDYPQYVQGGDIISFDIYPANHEQQKYNGQLWYVPFGVSRLNTWTQGKKIVWQCVEASPIHLKTDEKPGKGKVARDHVPTGREIRNEIWASIIHGSNGIIYFVHQFAPRFNESYLLSDKKLLAEVTAINNEVQALAAVINSPTIDNLCTVWYGNKNVPVKVMAKSLDGYIYIFAAAMKSGRTPASFECFGIAEGAEVEVIGENRSIKCEGRTFSDDFSNWDVHLYRVKADGFEGFSK